MQELILSLDLTVTYVDLALDLISSPRDPCTQQVFENHCAEAQISFFFFFEKSVPI